MKFLLTLCLLLVLGAFTWAETIPENSEVDSFWTDSLVIQDQKKQCGELAAELKKKGDMSKFLHDRFRLSYHNHETPLGGQYEGRRGLAYLAHKISHSMKVSKFSLDTHATDDLVGLCVLKGEITGTWTRSGKKFDATTFYLELKTLGSKYIGGRMFDGKGYGGFMKAYRTDAQQVLYDLSGAIFKSGYKSKAVKKHLSKDLKVTLVPFGWSKSGPKEFKGQCALTKATNHVIKSIRSGRNWRGRRRHRRGHRSEGEIEEREDRFDDEYYEDDEYERESEEMVREEEETGDTGVWNWMEKHHVSVMDRGVSVTEDDSHLDLEWADLDDEEDINEEEEDEEEYLEDEDEEEAVDEDSEVDSEGRRRRRRRGRGRGRGRRNHGRRHHHHHHRRGRRFPLPIPYSGHRCDIQFTNATSVIGACLILPPRSPHYEGWDLSANMGSNSTWARVHHKIIGESYLRGPAVYFHIHTDNGKVTSIFIAPMQARTTHGGYRTLGLQHSMSTMTLALPKPEVEVKTNTNIDNLLSNPEGVFRMIDLTTIFGKDDKQKDRQLIIATFFGPLSPEEVKAMEVEEDNLKTLIAAASREELEAIEDTITADILMVERERLAEAEAEENEENNEEEEEEEEEEDDDDVNKENDDEGEEEEEDEHEEEE